MKALIHPLSLTAVLLAAPALAGDWETWTDCQYVSGPANTADTFPVNCDGRARTIRLYSLVASPTELGAPAEYFGIPQSLARATATEATEFVAHLLTDNPFRVVTRHQRAGGADAVYAYVLVGKQDLGTELVARGYAYEAGLRASRPGWSAMDYVATLRDLEETARREGRGAWAHARARAPSINFQRDTGHRVSLPGRIRHNENCPYYNRKGNLPCAPDEGAPCKVCGG